MFRVTTLESGHASLIDLLPLIKGEQMSVTNFLQMASLVQKKNKREKLVPFQAMLTIALLFLLSFVSSCGATPSKNELDAEVKRLCAIDGGIKVYEAVLLPVQKSGEKDQLNIPTKQNFGPSDKFFYTWDVQYIKRGRPEDGETDLARSQFKLYRAIDNKIIGESIAYTRRGGDIPVPVHPSHFTCPTDSGIVALKKHVFIRSENGVAK